MLEKRFKLEKTDNIKGILKEGKELKTHFFVIKYQESEEKFSRFGIIISNKLSKKATNRNRARRQIYEIIRLNLETMSLKIPSKIVILPRAKTLRLSYQDMEKELLKAAMLLQDTKY